MAESKRAGGAEEPVQLDVKFDAQSYVRKEILNTRATIVLAIYGVLLGQVGFLVSNALKNPVSALAVFLLGVVGVKGVLEVCGVGTEEWTKKTWAFNVLFTFVTWLAAWIVFQNPPFTT